jgi:predicted NAD-dependent protein-ADP-ribosyltransferase YbiA (DUF1768 family)
MTDNAPIFFWQETHPHWGWLSQWYAIEFEHDGITYVTTEMWMMVQKAKLFKDEVGILLLAHFPSVVRRRAYRPWKSRNLSRRC